MPLKDFNNAICKKEKAEAEEKDQNPKYLKAKKYVEKYLVPTTSATHVLIQGKTIEIIQDETFKKVYLNRFPKEIKTWFTTCTIPGICVEEHIRTEG